MRTYFDTGPFIDFLSVHGNGILRTTDRRGRTPADLAMEAERLFDRVKRTHTGATSCLTYYEAEEANYRQLRQSTKGVPRADVLLIPTARAITFQVEAVADLFRISILDLTLETFHVQRRQLHLQTRGIRAADALHAASAIEFDADLLVSTDDALLQLDGILTNRRGDNIRCLDTDSAIHLL
jgi:predicted nucleic acid-binding protein